MRWVSLIRCNTALKYLTIQILLNTLNKRLVPLLTRECLESSHEASYVHYNFSTNPKNPSTSSVSRVCLYIIALDVDTHCVLTPEILYFPQNTKLHIWISPLPYNVFFFCRGGRNSDKTYTHTQTLTAQKDVVSGRGRVTERIKPWHQWHMRGPGRPALKDP